MKIKLDSGAFMPEYAHEQDAGMDLRSPVNAVVLPQDSALRIVLEWMDEEDQP